MRIAIGIITVAIVGMMTLIVGLVLAQEPNTITGTVTDARTGEPIQGATVSVEETDPPLSAETDDSGAYRITGVSTGERRTTASAEGYESETIEAEVTGSEGASIDFSLEPLGAEEDDADEEDLDEATEEDDADEEDLHEGAEEDEASAEDPDEEAEEHEASAEDPDEEAKEDEVDEEDPDEEAEEDEADEEAGEEAEDGKNAGDRKGYVGTFTPGNGMFTVTTKKGEVVVQIPEEGIESITRVPGQADPTGIPEDGARVAVLVEFVDEGAEELVRVARQIIVKPSPQPPIVGAVVSVETDESGVRTLTIMRPDGTTKEVRLGRKADPPEIGELVTAFRGRGPKFDGRKGEEGPPIIKGLVRAEQVRQRLEGFLRELTTTGDEPTSEASERRAQRVVDVAAILENHTAKHVDIIERVSKNDKLPPQAVEGMLKGLKKAQAGRAKARERAAEARAKAGPPAGRGDRGGQGRGGPRTQDSVDQADGEENGQGERGKGDQGHGGRDREDRGRDQDQSNRGSGKRGRTG